MGRGDPCRGGAARRLYVRGGRDQDVVPRKAGAVQNSQICRSSGCPDTRRYRQDIEAGRTRSIRRRTMICCKEASPWLAQERRDDSQMRMLEMYFDDLAVG